MVERQKVYERMIEYVFSEYLDLDIDRSTTAEAMLPDVRIDKLILIPKDRLERLRNSPFPFLQEVNLIHIKGINDHLTNDDIELYLGQLCIVAVKSRDKGKTCCLMILTSHKIRKNLGNKPWMRFKRTKIPWIYKFTQCPEKAYIFELRKELLEKQEYNFLLPFFPISVIKEKKQIFTDIAKSGIENKRDLLLLNWLREIHPEFYKEEIESMAINMEEVVRGLCPEALEKAKMEDTREKIVEALEVRFGAVKEGIREKIEKEKRKEILNGLFKKALQAASIAEFEEQFE